MSDLRISYDEEMVGADHPTKADTLNRLFLGGASPTLRDSDGKVLHSIFKKQTSDPSTGADEGALFAKEDAGGELALYWRRPGDGEVVEVGGKFEVVERIVETASLTAGTNRSHTVSLADTYDPAECFFRVKACGVIYPTDGANNQLSGVRFHLNPADGSQGIINFDYVGATDDYELICEVVRAPGGLKVQQGVDTLTQSSAKWATHTISLDAAVDRTKALALVGFVSAYGSSGSEFIGLDYDLNAAGDAITVRAFVPNSHTDNFPWIVLH
jgi:hypothetical protein